MTITRIIYDFAPTQVLQRNGSDIVVVASGGPPGATYRLLASTNAALPIAQWTPIATNVFNSSGGSSYTNAIKSGLPAQLYRVAVP
jgi:hypothetical protein